MKKTKKVILRWILEPPLYRLPEIYDVIFSVINSREIKTIYYLFDNWDKQCFSFACTYFLVLRTEEVMCIKAWFIAPLQSSVLFHYNILSRFAFIYLFLSLFNLIRSYRVDDNYFLFSVRCESCCRLLKDQQRVEKAIMKYP